jgi:hypothetical protein
MEMHWNPACAGMIEGEGMAEKKCKPLEERGQVMDDRKKSVEL